ncbi:hypothetical protein BDV96DRAFT_664207 [Lophiotrema nucula]|uniref:C2H2-type domain-containing protein n=1 Tax=Lophiotrema nucula TaxID=690887 RepID=A0A6A5Z0Q2_9PLEO|nr:hypothetical protein BDV96DRAFT_664207 [Lophiotrema nucula]
MDGHQRTMESAPEGSWVNTVPSEPHDIASYRYGGSMWSEPEDGPTYSVPIEILGMTQYDYEGRAIPTSRDSGTAEYDANLDDWVQGEAALDDSVGVNVDRAENSSGFRVPNRIFQDQDATLYGSNMGFHNRSSSRTSHYPSHALSHATAFSSTLSDDEPPSGFPHHIVESSIHQDVQAWGDDNPPLQLPGVSSIDRDGPWSLMNRRASKLGAVLPIGSDQPHWSLSNQSAPRSHPRFHRLSSPGLDLGHTLPSQPAKRRYMPWRDHHASQLAALPPTDSDQLDWSKSKSHYGSLRSSSPGLTFASTLPSQPSKNDGLQSRDQPLLQRSSTITSEPLENESTTTPPRNLDYFASPAVITIAPFSPRSSLHKELPDILYCPRDGCKATFQGDYRKSNIGRHLRVQHGGLSGSGVVYTCEAGGCDNTFKRKDARLKHYRKHHPWLSQFPFPISRKPTKSFLKLNKGKASSVPQVTRHDQQPSTPSRTNPVGSENRPQDLQRKTNRFDVVEDAEDLVDQTSQKVQLSLVAEDSVRSLAKPRRRPYPKASTLRTKEDPELPILKAMLEDHPGAADGGGLFKQSKDPTSQQTSAAANSNLWADDGSSVTLDPAKEHLVQNAVKNFKLWFVRGNMGGLPHRRADHTDSAHGTRKIATSRTDGGCGGEGRQDSSHGRVSEEGSSGGSNVAYNKAKRDGKRKISEDENGDRSDTERDEPSGKRIRRRDSPNGPLSDRLACPFFKHDSARNMRGACSGPGWKAVHRIKMHISRTHVQMLRCPRCHRGVIDHSELIQHLAETPQCARKDPEPPSADDDCMKIPSERENELRRFKQRGVSEPEKWKGLYLFIFPGTDEASVPSPYYEYETSESAETSQRNFLGLYSQRMPLIMENEFRRVVSEEVFDEAISERLNNRITELVQRGQQAFLREWTTTSSTLGPRSGESSGEIRRNIGESMAVVPAPSGLFHQNPLLGASPAATLANPDQGLQGLCEGPKPSASEAGHDSGYYSNGSPDLFNTGTPHLEAGSPSNAFFPELRQRERMNNAAIQIMLENTGTDGVTGFELGDIDIDPEIREWLNADLLDVPVDANWFSLDEEHFP